METSLVIALVVGVASLSLLWKRFFSPSMRLPPGPRPLPILGNLLLMTKFPTMADLADELKKTYGPIVFLWTGSLPTIIISSPEILQEALIKQGHIFMGRLQLDSVSILKNNHRGLLTGVGDRHRFFRKLVVSDIFSNRKVTGFRPIRHQEADILIGTLKKAAAGNGGLVSDFRLTIRFTICNMLLGICFGARLPLEKYLDMDEVMTQVFKMAIGKPRDFISLLKLFPDRRGTALQLRLKRTINEFFTPLIEERRRMLSSGKEPPNGYTFVDTLVMLQEQGQDQSIDITDEDILVLCLEILMAGIDTTALNLEYALANLINHPDIQEKLFQEISSVVGEKAVDEDDIPQLPYLQAVVKEALRRHSPGRVAPARKTLAPTKLAGYDIPANTVVLQHVEGVSLSSQIWENPLEFKPERFLNKTVDMTGSTEITLIPFGVGRRICPGINISLLHAHLILARLVQTFHWKLPMPCQLLDLSPGVGLSNPMKHPLNALVQER